MESPSAVMVAGVRTGSFFNQSRLTLWQICMLVFLLVLQLPVTLAASLIHVSEVSSVQLYQHCRDVSTEMLLRLNLSLGGVERVVEIDETAIRKRKYDRGRSVKTEWVSTSYFNLTGSFLVFTTKH
uniref:SJCHGC02977 protein n=1 Tax=Schistosoma japonicum TaxID=6182 RepID=Q5D9I4_SCHJA|nr:SJCHGC02977 protein [Schistosoma japonicum]